MIPCRHTSDTYTPHTGTSRTGSIYQMKAKVSATKLPANKFEFVPVYQDMLPSNQYFNIVTNFYKQKCNFVTKNSKEIQRCGNTIIGVLPMIIESKYKTQSTCMLCSKVNDITFIFC